MKNDPAIKIGASKIDEIMHAGYAKGGVEQSRLVREDANTITLSDAKNLSQGKCQKL